MKGFIQKGEGANVLWLFEFIKNHIFWFIKYFKIKENWFQFSENFHNQWTVGPYNSIIELFVLRKDDSSK